MEKHQFVLPGDKAEVASRREWVRSMVRGASLFGPRLRRLMRAATSGDKNKLHDAERRWARAAISALDLTVNVSGLHHVDQDRPYIVAPLHEGFADLLAIQHLPINMVYATAEELFEWRHLGPYLSASHQPSISRDNGPSAYRTLLRSGKEALARGESLVVFPQGTILGIETAFTGGAFRASRHLAMPVLPVVLTGASGVWDYPFSHKLNFGQAIRMEVLAPVPPNVAVARAKDLEREMKERALRATPGPRRYVPERDGWWDDYRFAIDPHFPDLHRKVQQHRNSVATSPASP